MKMLVATDGSSASDKTIDVASHGRHGLARVAMGSISARVVERAPCAVTVVK